MTRVPKLTRRYLRNAERLAVVPGSARGRAVGLTSASLLRDETLPATGEAFVRRVPGRSSWLWYSLAGDVVTVIGLTADPPVPADE